MIQTSKPSTPTDLEIKSLKVLKNKPIEFTLIWAQEGSTIIFWEWIFKSNVSDRVQTIVWNFWIQVFDKELLIVRWKMDFRMSEISFAEWINTSQYNLVWSNFQISNHPKQLIHWVRLISCKILDWLEIPDKEFLLRIKQKRQKWFSLTAWEEELEEAILKKVETFTYERSSYILKWLDVEQHLN